MIPTIFWIELLVVLICLFYGARKGGMALGLISGIGLIVLVFCFHVKPGKPPVDVILTILAVIMGSATLQASGGLDCLLQVAEKALRSHPRLVVYIAPYCAWILTILCGTGHTVYTLLPIIYDVAIKTGIRPERPMAVATIASQQSITASPVSAATAAMLGMFAAYNWTSFGLAQILAICVPSTLLGVIVAGFVSMFLGKDLADDPEFQARVKAGLVKMPDPNGANKVLKPHAKRSAIVFLVFVAIAVASGLIPELRTLRGETKPLGMATVLEIFMLVNAAAILVTCRPKVDDIVKTPTMRAGVVAMIGIFGLAWLGDSFVGANKADLLAAVGGIAQAMPWTFAFVLFFVSVLLYSQAATARAVMPLGAALGIPPQTLIGMFPAVNGYFFIPTYGSLVAAIAFDGSGTTHIGKYVLNHSFMIPGLVATIVAVTTGLGIAGILY